MRVGRAKMELVQARSVSRIALVSICKSGTSFRSNDVGASSV
jgi:hypothetical protein